VPRGHASDPIQPTAVVLALERFDMLDRDRWDPSTRRNSWCVGQRVWYPVYFDVYFEVQVLIFFSQVLVFDFLLGCCTCSS